MTRNVQRNTGAAKGFTLIELAVVLAIIAVLAAVMTPIITNYVDQSRVARATSDVKTIAEAIKAYNRDTAQYPIYSSFANMLADTAAVTCLTGPGNTATDSTSGTTWSDCAAGEGSFEEYLNTNKLIGSPGSGIMTTTATLGKVAFRGPYLTSVDSDPWANRYMATAANMTRASTNWAFVISAGPNQKVETLQNNTSTSATATATTAFVASGDDIIAVIK